MTADFVKTLRKRHTSYFRFIMESVAKCAAHVWCMNWEGLWTGICGSGSFCWA